MVSDLLSGLSNLIRHYRRKYRAIKLVSKSMNKRVPLIVANMY